MINTLFVVIIKNKPTSQIVKITYVYKKINNKIYMFRNILL